MRQKNIYFDSNHFDKILVQIQGYYKKIKKGNLKKNEEKKFEEYSNELGLMLHAMSNKILKFKSLCSYDDLNDVVNECIYNCFEVLDKNKFDPKKGKSFSFLTRIIQNTAVWYYYRSHVDIPFSVFQEKSFIEEPEENLIIYLAEYYKKSNYNKIDYNSKIKFSKSKNIRKKKELRLMPLYNMVESNFEDAMIKKMESGTIIQKIRKMIENFRLDPKYDKFECVVADGLLKFLDFETKIERVTIRRIKKFIVTYLLETIKRKRWKFKKKNVEDVKRPELIIFINKTFDKKIKPYLFKDPVIKSILQNGNL